MADGEVGGFTETKPELDHSHNVGCVLGQDDLLSHFLYPPKSVNSNTPSMWRTNPPYRKRWRLLHLPIILTARILFKPLKKKKKPAQKRFENVKPCIHNVVSSGENFVKIWRSMLPVGCVRFARNCGKMYSHKLFSAPWISHVPKEQGIGNKYLKPVESKN